MYLIPLDIPENAQPIKRIKDSLIRNSCKKISLISKVHLLTLVLSISNPQLQKGSMMRISLLLISTFFINFHISLLGMGQLFHLIDKNYVDPINYVTEAKSSDLCEQVLLLNPAAPSAKQFVLDQITLDQIHQGFEREEKILYIVEDAISNQDSHAPIEQIIRAVHPGYFSQNNLAVMYGYLTTKIKISEETAAKLKRVQESETNPFAVAPQSSTASSSAIVVKDQAVRVDAHDLSPSALEQLILESNPSWTMKLANLVRKAITNPAGYLTDSKSAIASEAILCFHPDHPQKNQFNRSIPLHVALVHQAFERQIRLHPLIETALKKKDHQTMLTLRQKVRKGYISKFTEAVINGYLKYAEESSVADTAIRKENAENSRKDSGSLNQPPAPIGKNTPLPDDAKCTCIPPKPLKDCPACLTKIKALLESAPTGSNPPANDDKSLLPPSVPIGKNPPMPDEPKCICIPPQLLKDCKLCIEKLKSEPVQTQPSPVLTNKKSPINLDVKSQKN